MRAILTLIVLGFALVGAVGADVHNHAVSPKPVVGIRNITQAKVVSNVKQTCDQAHREVSGDSERACADLQAITNTEYLCDGVSRSAYCWVEAK